MGFEAETENDSLFQKERLNTSTVYVQAGVKATVIGWKLKIKIRQYNQPKFSSFLITYKNISFFFYFENTKIKIKTKTFHVVFHF